MESVRTHAVGVEDRHLSANWDCRVRNSLVDESQHTRPISEFLLRNFCCPTPRHFLWIDNCHYDALAQHCVVFSDVYLYWDRLILPRSNYPDVKTCIQQFQDGSRNINRLGWSYQNPNLLKTGQELDSWIACPRLHSSLWFWAISPCNDCLHSIIA